MLHGEAKRDYQRDYMRKRRTGEPTRKLEKQEKPWQPTKRMRDQVRYWFRASNLSRVGRKIIEGLDPSNEAEALRRYKAHLDERKQPAVPEPKCCSFCRKPQSAERVLVGPDNCTLICEACTARAAAIFAKQGR